MRAGARLPACAEAVGGGDQVIGVDNDPTAVRLARERRADPPQVAVRDADVHALNLPASSVGSAHTDRVLPHVAEPGTALARARRVLRDAGTAVFAEPDWETLVIDYPDLATARAYTRYLTADPASQWLTLATEPFFASATLYIITATAS